MTIQSQLDNESLKKLTQVSEVINNAEAFERNQMINAALRAMMNSTTAIDDMNDDQLKKFEADLIESFKFKEWIK